MKRLLPALCALLVLVLALTPLSAAMADASHFEFEPVLASQLFRTYDQLEIQWFDDADYRALLAACLMIDASTESGWFDVNWEHPVVMVDNQPQYTLIYIDEAENICHVIYSPDEGSGSYSGLAPDVAETVYAYDIGDWTEEAMLAYAEKVLSRGVDCAFVASDDFDRGVTAVIEQLSNYAEGGTD